MKKLTRRIFCMSGFCGLALAASTLSWMPAAAEEVQKPDQFVIIDLEALRPLSDWVFEEESTETGEAEKEKVEKAIPVLNLWEKDLSIYSTEKEASEEDLEETTFEEKASSEAEKIPVCYDITRIYAEEPIIAQLLSKYYKDGYCSVGMYEIISGEELMNQEDRYDLNLWVTDHCQVKRFYAEDGILKEEDLKPYMLEGENAPKVSLLSDTDHWMVFFLGAADAESSDHTDEESSATQSLEGNIDLGTEEPKDTDTKAPTDGTTKAPETTKPTEKPTGQPETKPSETAKPTQKPTTPPETKAPETKPTEPPATEHTHNWQPVTKTVHHDATYKMVWVEDRAAYDEQVLVSEAWDESVLVSEAWDENVLVSEAWDEPVYEWFDICNACGHVFQAGEDINEHMAAGCWSSWHAELIQVGSVHHEAVYQTVHHDPVYSTVHHDPVYNTVHHDAEGHNESVVDQPAWDETVTTGYKCPECGAVK